MSDLVSIVHGAKSLLAAKGADWVDGEPQEWDIRNCRERLFKKAQYTRVLTNKAGKFRVISCCVPVVLFRKHRIYM